MKDDLLYISALELELLFSLIETIQSEELSCTSQDEDDEFSVVGRDVNASEGEQDDTVGSDFQSTQAKESGPECEPDQLYSIETLALYLTPESTPPPPAALLATAIRSSDSIEKDDNQRFLSRIRGESEKSDTSRFSGAIGNWTAAFNAGRLVSPLSIYGGVTVSKAKVAKTTQAPYPNSRTHQNP